MPVRKSLPNTVWEGDFFETHSLAQCNFNYAQALLRRNPSWNLGLFAEATEGRSFEDRLYRLPHPVECTVRFQYPPDFRKPPFGHLIAMQPWEYGACPSDWVYGANEILTELWTPTSFVRDCFIKSGVAPDKVFVVPHGIEPSVYTPTGDSLPLETGKGFNFLFVGGTIPRKGADVLLAAYVAEFGPDEDVCLVVKEFGAQSFYRGQTLHSEFRAAESDPNRPSILLLHEDLPFEAMPKLYRACDALVHPFRGEGYGLPIAEAMACGLPVVVTNHGAPLDFVDATTGYLVDAQVTAIPGDGLKSMELVGEPYWAEPEMASLRRWMRHVFENREEARSVGRRAAETMRASHTWDHAAQVAEERLLSLPEVPQGNRFSFAEAAAIAAHELERREKKGKDLLLVERALDACPEEPNLLAAKAKALISAGEWDSAFQLLQESPKAPPVVGQLCWMYAHTQKESSAWDLAQAGMKDNNEDFRFIASLEALYGHYVCLGTAKWSNKAVKKEAKLRASKLGKYLEARGWDPAMAEPLGTRLSLCMIVKDEEKFLPQCLESVRGIVDEMVIVDTGSRDRTVEIAEARGAQVHTFAWTDDFSEARNEALKHCTGDWVLWLDADEALEPSSVGPLREAMVRPQFGSFLMQVVNFMSEGSTNDVFTHHPCRLFRRIPGARFSGKIHEQVLPSIAEAGMLSANLAGARILHYGYAAGTMDEKKKLDRTMRLVEAELDADPDSPFHQFNLGNTLYVRGDYERAVEAFAYCADRIEKSQDYCATAYHLWAAALVNLKRPQEALHACERADGRGVESPAIEFSRATALYVLDRFADALSAAGRAREIPWQDQTTGDFTVTTYKLEMVEGQCFLGLDEISHAIERLETSVRHAAEYPTSRYFLGLAYARAERYPEAIEQFEKAYADPKLAEAALQMNIELMSRLGSVAKAAQLAGRLCRSKPHDDEHWNKWVYLAERAQDWREVNAAYAFRSENHALTGDMYINWGRACATMQDWKEAMDHFEDAIELDPSNANAFFNAGDCLYQVGAYQEAADAYQTGLRADPENAEGWFVLGNSFYRMRMFDGAKIAFEQTLMLRPNHTRARSNLELVEEAIRSTAA